MLLLIAHGSRKQDANDEVRRLAERVQSQCEDEYEGVIAAFLELADPDIRKGVAECASRGATEVVAVPYFLAAGRHVASDIPDELELARAENPALEIRMSRYLGSSEAMTALVLDAARQQDQAVLGSE